MLRFFFNLVFLCEFEAELGFYEGNNGCLMAGVIVEN